jgi:hypothetical protein
LREKQRKEPYTEHGAFKSLKPIKEPSRENRALKAGERIEP